MRIGGAGVCHSDLHLLYEFDAGLLPIEPPFTLGHENAGWIESRGAGVTGFEVGEPVAVYGTRGAAVIACDATRASRTTAPTPSRPAPRVGWVATVAWPR